MSVKGPGLILGLALFIFACEDPGEIGLELNPENGVFVAKYQEVPLDNSVLLYEDILSDNTVRFDSLDNVTSQGRLLTGSFSNANFGKTTAKGYTRLFLGALGFSNDTTNYVFDSLVLRMQVDYGYGDFFGNKKINIYELSEPLKDDTTYLTRNSSPHFPDPVGEFNFDLSSFDTLRVDTLLTTKLSEELGMRFMEEATFNDSTYLNNDEFVKFFNGFAFGYEESNNMVTGLLPDNTSSFLRMHFHNARDTTFIDFIFQDRDTIPGNLTKYYNTIRLDRTGSALEGIQEYYTEFETATDRSYIQGAAGVFTKLDFQPYLQFLDTIDHLVINRAEILIPVFEYENNNFPSSPLDLYVVDENNRFIEDFVPAKTSSGLSNCWCATIVCKNDQ